MSCPAIPFNTLRHFERMKKVGFTDEQAKEQTEAMAELLDERLATKTDIEAIHKDIDELKSDMRSLGAAMGFRYVDC